jgi:uncharacterized protein (DUF1330 family)
MAKGYWIATFQAIHDQEAWAEYARRAVPALQSMGARYLVRGNPVKVYENGVMGRTVLIEFDSVAQAIAAHDSPGYQHALEALGPGAVEREIRIVEGVE